MEFKVTFVGNIMRGEKAISLPDKNLGADWVNTVRADLELPALTIYAIVGFLPFSRQNPTITLALEEAAQSGHFADKNFVEVEVPNKGDLNEFYKIVPVPEWDPDSGKIIRVRPEYWLDRRALLAEWARRGYPIIWGEREEAGE